MTCPGAARFSPELQCSSGAFYMEKWIKLGIWDYFMQYCIFCVKKYALCR